MSSPHPVQDGTGLSPSAEALRRIMEVRQPISPRLPRGWNTVGLDQTVGLLILVVMVVGGGAVSVRYGAKALGDIQSRFEEMATSAFGSALGLQPAPEASSRKPNPLLGGF